MHLLYISGTYFPSNAGAEISAHTLLRLLCTSCVRCTVITQLTNDENDIVYSIVDGIEVFRIVDASHEEQLLNLVNRLSPDVILTQLMWSDVAIRVARRCKVPSILRVCKIPYEVDISVGFRNSPTEVLAVSTAAAVSVKKLWGRECHVIPPSIDPKLVRISQHDQYGNPYIAMFNPIRRKGGNIFRQVASMMPHKKFAFIPGWHCLRDKNGNFDTNKFSAISKSLGVKYSNELPEETDFNGLSNVTALRPSTDVRTIYCQVKILCIPSIWDEAFGRVAIEAFMNGIPVLGSPVGGLRDHIAEGGILIDDHLNPKKWSASINLLESREQYNRYSAKARSYIKNHYDVNATINDFYRLLRLTIHKHGTIE